MRAFLILLVAGAASCASLPQSPATECERIPTGPGPEDFAVDRSTGTARILVSSHDRRAWTRGEIYATDPLNPKTPTILKREGEPKDVFFAPHGMDLFTTGGRTFLYVISHGAHRETGRQQVLVYEVSGNVLRFRSAIESALFTSPNDLAVDETGGVFVSNDAAVRGSFFEMALALARSTVVYCPFTPGETRAQVEGEQAQTEPQKPACVVARGGLAMANGVAVNGPHVFVSTTRGNNLTRYERDPNGVLKNGRELFSATSLDNLFFWNQSGTAGRTSKEIIVTSHPAGLAFMRHAGNPDVASPSVVYAVDIESGKSRTLYANDGKEISAASGAFVLGEFMYVSQVFESHLLKCRVPLVAPVAGGAKSK